MDQKILFLVIFFVPLTMYSQGSEPTIKENRSAFIAIGMGAGPSSFRDKATSPLFYQGVPATAFISRVKINNRRETNFGVRGVFGGYLAEVNERQAGSANFSSFSLEYSSLHQLQSWSDEDWNFKAGGTLVTTANFRSNEQLQNNSFGFEGFLNLMGSFKITRDVSRTMEKQMKLWFINYTLHPRKRSLSYRLNIGLWNNSFRNGYAYHDQNGLLNEKSYIWEDYVFRTFSGLRFSSEVSYTLFLLGAKNNAVEISYFWDAVRTKPGTDNFAMVFHVIKFSLLYNTR